MPYKIQTPQEVWRDYDPEAEPLAEECIFESVEVNRARTVKDYVFTALCAEDGGARVFCRAVVPIVKRGVVVLIEDYEPRNNQPLIDRLAEEGYAVLIPDYGDRMNCGTKFPPSLSYGKLSANADRRFKMTESPKDTCQFLYGKIIKRTVTFAKLLFPDLKRVALGMGNAAELAVSAAGSDDRIDGLVVVNGGVYREYLSKNRFDETLNETMDDHAVGWMSGVASAAYAKNAACPALLIAGTNSERFDCDRLQTVAQLMKRSDLRVNLTAGGAETADERAFSTLIRWLSALTDRTSLPERPEIKLRFEDGLYSVYVKTSVEDKPDAVTVYFAFDEYDHRFRNWRSGAAKLISEQNEYLFQIPEDAQKGALFAFAEADYGGARFASNVCFSDERPETTAPTGAKLVMNAKDGIKCFCAETDEEILVERAVSEVKTSVGLTGVTARRGALRTFVLNERRKIGEDAVLQINFFTEVKRKVALRAVFCGEDETAEFGAAVEVPGASEAFTAVSFPAESFKNVEMRPMEDWTRVKSLSIDANGAVIGNILFI